MARSGFEVQKVTVEALFLREIRTRFGKFRLGYLWAILEPSAHLLILLGIFGYIMHRTMPDISFPVFLLNGLIPFFIFSSISNRSVGAIEANQGLFNYRPVKPIDTIIARALLETLIYVAVYILLMLIVWMAGEYFEITNFLQLVLTWSLLIILSCGVGLIFMVVGKTFPEMQRSCRYCLSRCISSPASCSSALNSKAILVVSTLEPISACRGVKPRGSYAWLYQRRCESELPGNVHSGHPVHRSGVIPNA